MERLIIFFKKHVYLYSILVLTVTLGIYTLCRDVIFRIDAEDINSYYGLPGILYQIIPLIIVFLIVWKFTSLSKIGFTKEKFGKGLLLGWYIIFMATIMVVVNVVQMVSDNVALRYPGYLQIIYAVILTFVIGLFEELLCRGIILNAMFDRFGNTKKGIYKSVILSALFFGVSHLLNLIIMPTQIVATIIQVFFATFFGVLVGAIYLRCRNIWTIVFLHSLYDLSGIILSLIVSNSIIIEDVPVDISVSEGLITLGMMLPMFIIGLILLRKVRTCSHEGNAIKGQYRKALAN